MFRIQIMDNAIALVDCNNFYVSCERLFDKSLQKRPVVVLSNNDGCIISRSDEVKKMGVKMAEPLFKVKALLEANNTAIISSNIEHYCEISRRVMKALREDVSKIEIYSIDEAFLDLGTADKTCDVAFHIKNVIWESVGIPVSVGIAKTKTVAKIANHLAKKSVKAKGVVDLYESRYLDFALEKTEISDIWGIGRRLSKRLNDFGIINALQLKNADVGWIQREFSVLVGRTILELRGVKCIPFEIINDDKKTIAHTRSFGHPVVNYQDLKNAVIYFTTRAVEKMRRDGLCTKSVTVFARTSRYKPDFATSSTIYESVYHSDLRYEINDWALQGLEKIFEPGLEYKKVGVVLGGLVRVEKMTRRLFENESFEKWRKLEKTIDELNLIYGKDFVKLTRLGNLDFWRSSRSFENENANLPVSPKNDANTSEFRRFL
jgi:DNA polymerase V